MDDPMELPAIDHRMGRSPFRHNRRHQARPRHQNAASATAAGFLSIALVAAGWLATSSLMGSQEQEPDVVRPVDEGRPAETRARVATLRVPRAREHRGLRLGLPGRRDRREHLDRYLPRSGEDRSARDRLRDRPGHHRRRGRDKGPAGEVAFQLVRRSEVGPHQQGLGEQDGRTRGKGRGDPGGSGDGREIRLGKVRTRSRYRWSSAMAAGR